MVYLMTGFAYQRFPNVDGGSLSIMTAAFEVSNRSIVSTWEPRREQNRSRWGHVVLEMMLKEKGKALSVRSGSSRQKWKKLSPK